MAWLARSIANSLKVDDNEDEVGEMEKLQKDDGKPNTDHEGTDGQRTEDDRNTPRGVKEDLSELSKTLRSQLWGVASFLAPPPSDQPEEKALSLGDREASGEEDVVSGIRSDFAEIGGRFRTGMSKLSSNIAVSEFTKIASNLLQLGSDEEVANAVGVTSEVVAFARDIAMHPETWLDFPFPDEDDNFGDFDMTNAQQEHALAVERLAPRLAALRIELCPGYMSESCFWKIYFVLLHPKLSKHDALLLSTPQVLEARAMLSNELQRRNKPLSVKSESLESTIPEAPASMEQPLSVSSNDASESTPLKTISIETTPSMDPSTSVTEKHPVQVTETHTVDKSVVDEVATNNDKPQNPTTDSSRILTLKSDNQDDDEDDWLKDEETAESFGAKGTMIPIRNDEDVSFSDLEDDEDGNDVPITRKNATSGSDSSDKNIKPVGDKHGVSGQVSQTKESNDWLDVDDIDVV